MTKLSPDSLKKRRNNIKARAYEYERIQQLRRESCRLADDLHDKSLFRLYLYGMFTKEEYKNCIYQMKKRLNELKEAKK